MEIEILFNRWVALLRDKASDYEHKARGRGERVTEPDIESICNEMQAFLVGLIKK